MKILIIWECVPEFTDFYILDADSDTLELVKHCHNSFVNQADLPAGVDVALNELSELLSKQTPVHSSSSKDEPFCLEGKFIVIHTGQLL